MVCKHLLHLLTPLGVTRVSLAAEAVFAWTNRPCLGTIPAIVPRCVEPNCPYPASSNVHVCVECVYAACESVPVAEASSPSPPSPAPHHREDRTEISDLDIISRSEDRSSVATAPRIRPEAHQQSHPDFDRTVSADIPDNAKANMHCDKLTNIVTNHNIRNCIPSTITSAIHSQLKHRSHLAKHDFEAAHPISLSVDHGGRLFCSRCNDFVYNPYLDAAVELQRRIAVSHRRNFRSSQSPLDPQPHPLYEHVLIRGRTKRRRVVSAEHWAPTKHELDMINANSVGQIHDMDSHVAAPVGLYNLGNSCYMNSVLQAFLNAPPLRCFFLADGHRPHCTRNPKSDCLACAMDLLVCNSYAGELACASRGWADAGKEGSSPPVQNRPFLVPQRVLEIMWKHAENLASYMQHDAHEFLIASLNVLNAHCRHAPQRNSSTPSSLHDNSKSAGGIVNAVTNEFDLLQEQEKSTASAAYSFSSVGNHVSTSPLQIGLASVSQGLPSSPVANLRGSAACLPVLPMTPSYIGDQNIVHNLFSGTLQSDVICRVCGNSSPTLEKFFDISLDVDNVPKINVGPRRSRGPSPEALLVGVGTEQSGSHGSSASALRDGKMTLRGTSGFVEMPGGASSENKQVASSNDSNTRINAIFERASGLPHVLHHGVSSPSSSSITERMDGSLAEMDTPNSLAECLSRFTEPEMLGSSAKMFCSVCDTRQEAMKQMSIRALPPVLCLHFKRFEQSFAKVRRSEMVKVDTTVEFPVDGLNMEAFRTSSVLRRRLAQEKTTGRLNKSGDNFGSQGERGKENRTRTGAPEYGARTVKGGKKGGDSIIAMNGEKLALQTGSRETGAQGPMSESIADPRARTAASPIGPRPQPAPMAQSLFSNANVDGGSLYDLFAVVNHTGKIDRGHYTTLVRRRGSWFRCDDEKVTPEQSIGSIIRSGEAYLLFYVQREPNFMY